MKKWKKAALALGGVAIVVVAVIIIFRPQPSKAAFAQDQNMDTTALAKTEIIQKVSVSGVVESAQTTNIYSTQSYPVQEIYVKVGDRVKAGDVLAQLDMSRLENDIAQTQVNLNSALASAAEEQRSNGNSVSNAKISMESSQISFARQQLNTANTEKDLQEAEAKVKEDFDSYTYDNTIEDARINLERKWADKEKAEEDLQEATEQFDNYTYQNNINEALITLERKQTELAEAEKSLTDEQKNKAKAFDDYNYVNAISDAEKNYERKKQDYIKSQENYYNALNDYYALFAIPTATDEMLSAALSKAESAQKSMESASQAVDDAFASVEKANTDLNRARNDYNDQKKDAKGDAVDAAEKKVESAQNALFDAQRNYNKAVSDMERAQRDAIDNAASKLTSAQNSYEDVRRSYIKAMNDKARAIENYVEDVQTKLESAQKSYADSQKQLESSQNNLHSAQNTLNQAASKPVSANTSVEIQSLNLEKLNKQLAEGKIVATADGVITEINATVGATPNGVLFVIEDTENLYVSAKIKEYNLSSVAIGQSAVVTTDATGDKVYDAAVSYISPKAVSAAGSTSVEFEIHADLASADPGVKIGMNAFLSVITASKQDVYAVPLSMVVTNEQGSFVYALNNGERVEIPVALGTKTSTHVEISGEGLYDGLELLKDPKGLIGTPNTTTRSMFGF